VRHDLRWRRRNRAGLYHDSLVASVERSSLNTAEATAAGLRRAVAPAPLPMPVAPGVPRLQILDASGNVIGGDPASIKDPPFTNPVTASGPNQRVTTVTASAYLPEHRAVLAAVRVVGPGGADTVVVAQSLDEADQQTSQAVELSTVIGAASVAMVAAVAWLAVGRTLRRVERLRAQVRAIAASGDLDRRVPESGADELAGLGVTLNEMLAALARASDRQRRFVADAAHELRTPIAGLNASIDVSVRHPHLACDPAWLGEMSDDHHRLGRLVDDLLVFARLDEHAPHRRGPVELAGLVTDAARRRTPEGVRIELKPLGPAMVLGDETQLDRILTNLIDNAVRHARSAVCVALTTRDGEAVITVTDDGPGVPAPDRDRIWERFTRLDDARSRGGGGGSGLGLALVKELTQAHGGTTHVTDADPDTGGAAFHIHIPLHH
jgi:signal transduction histidine kinase